MKVALLCGWGGHMQEMFNLRNAWDKYDYTIITYESERLKGMKESMIRIHPPWLHKLKFLRSLASALVKLLFDRPDVLISTGMGMVDIFLFPFCKFLGTYTIYIESAANVHKITGTGDFVKHFADRFLVNWKDLADEIGAEYKGGVF